MEFPDLSAELHAFGEAAFRARLLASTCGNASLRDDAGRIHVSGSGSELGDLCGADVAVVDDDGQSLAGARPSMETDLHCRAFRVRPGVRAVLHCQSPSATALACMQDPPVSLDFIPEVPAYVRSFAEVPYFRPGSTELALAVEEALTDPQVTIVQMRNHGQVIVGSTWQHVIRRATFFELAAWMYLQNPSLVCIPDEEAAFLRGMNRGV